MSNLPIKGLNSDIKWCEWCHGGMRLKGLRGRLDDDRTKWHQKTRHTQHKNARTRRRAATDWRRSGGEEAARLAARSHARLVEPAKSLPTNRSSYTATPRARGQGRKLNGANEQTCYFTTKRRLVCPWAVATVAVAVVTIYARHMVEEIYVSVATFIFIFLFYYPFSLLIIKGFKRLACVLCTRHSVV